MPMVSTKQGARSMYAVYISLRLYKYVAQPKDAHIPMCIICWMPIWVGVMRKGSSKCICGFVFVYVVIIIIIESYVRWGGSTFQGVITDATIPLPLSTPIS